MQNLDLFSSQFQFSVGKSILQTQYGTKKGVFLSCFVCFFALGYFIYLLYLFFNNLIYPNYKSQRFITDQSINISLNSDLIGFRFEYQANKDIQILQAQQNKTYLIFYAYFTFINGTDIYQKQLDIIQCQNPLLKGYYCLDFSEVQQKYTLSLSTTDNYYSRIFIYSYGCLDQDSNKNYTPNNCATQAEIDQILNGYDAGMRLKLFTQQYNTQSCDIQTNYRNSFIYTIGNSIVYSSLKAQKQNTQVKQGLFIQSSQNFSSPIAYEIQNQLWDRKYAIDSISQSGYNMIEIKLDEIVEQIEISYPTIPQILALVNSVVSLLMITKIIARNFSMNKIKNDLFLKLLQNFHLDKYLQIIKSSKLIQQEEEGVQILELQEQKQIISLNNKSLQKQEESELFQEQFDEAQNQNQQINVPNIDFRNKQSLDQLKSCSIQQFFQQDLSEREKEDNLNAQQLLINKQSKLQFEDQIRIKKQSTEQVLKQESQQKSQSQNQKLQQQSILVQFSQPLSNRKLVTDQLEGYQANYAQKDNVLDQNNLKISPINQLLKLNESQQKNLFKLKKQLSEKLSEKVSSVLFKFKQLMGNCHQNSIIPSICQHDQIKKENYSQFSSFRKQISLVINNSKGNTQSLIEELSQKMIQYQQITHYYISFESEDFINHIGNLNNAFYQSNQIIELSLNFQRLSIQNNGLQKIGQCLSHCQKLKKLELCLGSNQFTYEGIQTLCKTITKLKLLERVFLELYINQLESDSVVDIGEVVAELPCLISLKLDFSFNNVQFDGIQKFINSINKSEQLQCLDLTLDVNNILDIGSLALKQIEQKIQLTQLSLSLCSNNISNIDQLIDSISQLYNLYYLAIDLSYNPIGALVDQLEIVKKLNNLKKLLVFKFKMRVTSNHRFAKKFVKTNFKKLVVKQFNS